MVTEEANLKKDSDWESWNKFTPNASMFVTNRASSRFNHLRFVNILYEQWSLNIGGFLIDELNLRVVLRVLELRLQHKLWLPKSGENF